MHIQNTVEQTKVKSSKLKVFGTIYLLFLCIVTSNPSKIQNPYRLNQEARRKIQELIQFSLSSHYKPITLRPVISNNLIAQDMFDWSLISHNAPILLLNARLSPKIRRTFFGSTVLYWIFDETSFEETIDHLRNETANRRWDSNILIGKLEFIRAIFDHPVIQGLRLKVGLSTDDLHFWFEPRIFNSEENRAESLEVYANYPVMGKNLRGRKFKVGGCEFPPWTLKIRDENGGERVAGTHYQMVAFAAKIFNFTFETHVLDGPNYGELHPNGSWSGMYAQIYYREKNIDWVFMLGHDASWSADVDYASTFGMIDLIFATGWPSAELKLTAVLEPFQNIVWSAILVSFLCIAFFIFIFMKIQCNHISKFRKTKSKKISILDAVQIPYSIIVEQGIQEPDGVKSLIGVWLIFTIVIGTGYKSTLKSRLTYPTPETLPSNYKELAARNDYNIILNAQGVVEKYFFATTKVAEMINIRNRLNHEFSTEKCVTAAFLDPHSACIGWYPYFKQTASATLTLFSGLEPLIYTKQAAHFNSLSMAFQKDSIFVDAWTPITAALFETGNYQRWEEEVNNYYKEIGRQKIIREGSKGQIYDKLVELSKAGETVAKPLKNKNLSIVYVLLLIGWVLGALLFFMEKIYWKRVHKNTDSV